MIGLVIKLLQNADYYGTGSEAIEIAKGKYQLATDIPTAKRKIKRLWQSKKR